MEKKSKDKFSDYPMSIRKFMDPTLCLLYDDKFSKDEHSVSIIKEALSPNTSILIEIDPKQFFIVFV